MKKALCPLLFALLVAGNLPAQQIKEMEFKNQAITDILLALGEVSGKSIVPDETVTGTASYYFTETDFETALKIFLSTYKMYYWKEGNIYYVSRVRASWNKDSGTATIDAEDVEVRLIVRALSRAIGKTILFDSLPRETLSIHVDAAKPAKILELLMKRFPDYTVEAGDDFQYIKHVETAARPEARAEKVPSLVGLKDEQYSVDTDKARLKDILVDLFQKAGHEYSLLLRTDAILENLHFSGKSFPEILRLVLEQANADYAVENGIYYVFDIQRADVMKKLKVIRPVFLQYLSVQDLPNLLPPDMGGQNLYRMDKNTNTVILSGSSEEITPIEEYIRTLDRPLGDKRYYRFDLSYLKVSDFLSLLPPQLSGIKPIALPQGSSFVMLLTPAGKKTLDDYLPLIDRKQEGVPVQLRYIQADSLLKNLPPSVAKEDILQTGDSTLVFFSGTEDKRRQFLRELDVLDRPTPQIRYELLVVQYEGGENLNWGVSLDTTSLTGVEQNAFLGSIGKLLSLNFDIVSTFGYLFAIKLNADLGTNKANVLADTTLNGISGQEIKFQNTTTTRYREVEIDPNTGKPNFTGVTREVTSGLIISMNGWVSGDGIITMKVSSTVSKQGADTSATTGNPPPTSEKVVATNVRTISGKPVVIGGLMQQEKTYIVNKVPFLGDIPLLGLLFQSKSDTLTNTELVIYIVPHVEFPEMRLLDAPRHLESLYERYVRAR
jgi:type II secretory pathway component GspD/PulD (secretin)